MNSCKNNPRKIPFKHFWSFPFKIPVVLCFSTIKSTIMKKYPYKKLPVMINDRRWIRFRSFLRDEFKLWFLIKLIYPVTIYAGLVYAMKWLKYNNRSLIHAIFYSFIRLWEWQQFFLFNSRRHTLQIVDPQIRFP